ncbi:MAG: hypothetical protein O6952_00795 [Planctomycetota bacterium]|nr:hypothetical protein [Planctomycetota bacterium]
MTGEGPPEHTSSPLPSPLDATKLFLLGFLTLFLELVLIRYLAGNIWNLGYFPNLVLLAVFLGMGFGFLLHHRISDRLSGWLYQGSALSLLTLVALTRVMDLGFPGLGEFGGEIGGELFFSAGPKAAASGTVLTFALWFTLVLITFLLISQRTAKLFRNFAPLKAYTLDIAGSCCGILAFMLLSGFRVPAYLWFFFVIPPFLAAVREVYGPVHILGMIPFLVAGSIAYEQDQRLMSSPQYQGPMQVHWSPYQKIEYVNAPREIVPKRIYVNGIAHQAMGLAPQILGGQYQGPYDDRKESGRPPYRRVLIIGAGSGNDVACALLNGVEEVDAVEIDPVIAELGKKHHPLQPYSDPRVNLVVDDGRAFMTRARPGYDLVIFAVTDSVVKVSSMTQLRLENYLFTEDSFRRAFDLLTETGDVALYNVYRRDWLIEKYRRTIHAATGRLPRTVWQMETAHTLLVGRWQDPEDAPPPTGDPLDIATDDWPFPYLKSRGIPTIYFTAMLFLATFVLAMALLLHRMEKRGRAGGAARGSLPTKLAFAFMGAAFLLLETKSIVQFSLLFGTTWLNSSLVFLAILLLVLAANWSATLLRQRWVPPAVYLLLIASCLIGFLWPVSNLLAVESVPLRFCLASLMTFSPIFFANMLFSLSFRHQKVAEHIFGWNLLGASVGGLVEYGSMAIGYNALAIIVAVCYTLVVSLLLLGRRRAPVSD